MNDTYRDVDDTWTVDVAVTELTDTDLLEQRTDGTTISNPGQYAWRLAESVRRREGLETVSAACDYAIRVYLAYLIDSGQVDDLRDEYDVRYLIPPGGWTDSYDPSPVDIDAVSDDVDGGSMHVALPPTVKQMLVDVVEYEETDVDSIRGFVVTALEYVAGV